jgi:hypothetical protein
MTAPSTDHTRPEEPLVDEAIARRNKAMATTGPLHHLEASKAHMRDGAFKDYTPWDLAFHAIDVVTTRMNFDRGAGQDEVADALFPVAATQQPDRPAAEHRAVVEWVINELLGTNNAQRAFSAAYGDYSERGYVLRLFEFKLLDEERAEDGRIYLRATDAAINVLIGALDTDVESAQHAAEAKLEHLVRKGKLTDAELAARTARLHTIRLGEYIRRDIAAARRDLRAVDWAGEISDRLDSALGHIAERLLVEAGIAETLRQTADAAETGERRAQAHKVIAVLDECMTRHNELQVHVMRARGVFLQEQERQLFRPGGDVRRFDMREHLLLPMLGLTVRDAAASADRFFAGVMGACPPRSLRLTQLAESLLQPPRVPQILGDELITPELVERAPYEAFTAGQRGVAADILEAVGSEPVRLSALLGQALQDSTQAAHCVALHVLRAYHPQLSKVARTGGGQELIAYPDGRKLPAAVLTAVGHDGVAALMGDGSGPDAHPAGPTGASPFSGDDLLVVRVRVSAARQELAA